MFHLQQWCEMLNIMSVEVIIMQSKVKINTRQKICLFGLKGP